MAKVARVLVAVTMCAALMVVVTGCKKADGPPLCSPEAQARLKNSGASEEVIAKACPSPGTQPPPEQGGQQPEPAPRTWKVQPTSLSLIRADPPSYTDKPTLVFVAVKPSDYFNYGYSNARNSHFAFEMRMPMDDGRIGSDLLHGYAARSWARPFFEAVNKRLEGGKYEYAAATLVVAYAKKRYQGDSADHIEILAAEPGKKLDMDPTPLVEKAAQAADAEAKTKEMKEKARQQARASCSDDKMRRIFAENCSGAFAWSRMHGGTQTFDVNYFCRCAANRVNLDWAREIHENCSIPDSAALAKYLDSDGVVLACRR